MIIINIFLETSSQLEDILNTIDRLQQFRLDDQRTNFPSSTNLNNDTNNQSRSPLNEQFFDQLVKSQVSFSNKKTNKIFIFIFNS
jgi:hypothetical protein